MNAPQDFTRGIKLRGVKEAVEALLELRPALVRKTMRIAMNAAASPILGHARALTPKESGLLKLSLGIKVSAKKDGEWFAAVGPKRGNKRAIRTTAKGTKRLISKAKQTDAIQRGQRLKYRNPTRYAHLAEKGTAYHEVSTNKRTLANGTGGYFGRRVYVKARGRSMLQSAAVVKGKEASENAIRKINEGITNESARLYAIQTAKAGV